MKSATRAPWATALAVSIPLAAAYLLWRPPSGDLAAATYRADLFARVGFTLWDNGWYGGHYLPGYSLLSPALGALLGERLLLALSVVAASACFALLVERAFEPSAARLAAGLFALGLCVELLSGRVAYDLGVAIALLALVALQRGHGVAACGLAVVTSVTSPVAGAFLGLAGVAWGLVLVFEKWARRGRARGAASNPPRAREELPAPTPARGGVGNANPSPSPPKTLPAAADRAALSAALAVTLGALTPIALLSLAFPEGGHEPFAPSVFWPGIAGILAIALLLPRLRHELSPRTNAALRWGAWLYAAALLGSYVLTTPVGSNAARLGELAATPLVAGALWTRHRLALALLAPVLLYWQLETPLNDYAALAGEPSVRASYYAPLVAELQRLSPHTPVRVEVPQTGAHWESVYVPRSGRILLARGWERQLDTRYAPLFYAPRLTPGVYREWLSDNAVAYVALPDTRLDYSAAAEGSLIARGLPYLREVWRAPHWRLFAVRAPTPLAQRPAVLAAAGPDWFALRTPARGDFVVRIRFTPYWALRTGTGCVSEAPGGWTRVRTDAPGRAIVRLDFAPARIFDHGPRCRA